MQIILSHMNLDFDGLASMIAAKKLHPQAEIVLPSKISSEVQHFLAIYKDTFPFKRQNHIHWELVTTVILVDTNTLERIGDIRNQLPHSLNFMIYDHHHITEQTPQFIDGTIEKVGATITLLSEYINAQKLHISPFEATVFSLGLYSDTGAFTYSHTTSRDLKAGAYFLEKGANLRVVDQFREAPLNDEQHHLFKCLLDESELISIDGVDIVIATRTQADYTGHLAHITRKLLHVTGADVVFSIAEMGTKTYITTRATSERVNVLPIIQSLEGGGHEKAASAMRKGESAKHIYNYVKHHLTDIVQPSLTAKDMMSSPVRVVAPDTKIETVSKMLYRYGHTGFPVVVDNHVVGVISRRDVDKALHHKLGHAPVKGYMNHQPITISLYEKVDKIRELMIEDRVGRLPVIHNNELVGIVSRTDVIQAMHGKKSLNGTSSFRSNVPLKRQFIETMRSHFPPPVFGLLKLIGNEADGLSLRSYLIGGMVRDLLLEKQNEDMDIVVEGDGINFALHLQNKYGGTVRKHDKFRTATWRHPSGYKIDLTSARTEYYDFPAALPKVELSNIKEDLLRRDFTINAMGICLHKDEFGELLDYFNGYNDLKKGTLKVLYNLSFVEDPTRILRAIRFESRFQFKMDDQTERLAEQSANNILSVSKPRLANELVRLFTEEDPTYAIKRMQRFSLQTFLVTNHSENEVANNNINRLFHWHQVLKNKGITIKRSIWICYMYFLTTGKFAGLTELESYCLTKEDLKTLHDLQQLLLDYKDVNTPLLSKTDLHDLFSNYQLETLLAFFTNVLPEKNYLPYQYLIDRENLKLKIDGHDLKQLGLKPSPLFKEILSYAETQQLESPNITRKELFENIRTTYLSKR